MTGVRVFRIVLWLVFFCLFVYTCHVILLTGHAFYSCLYFFNHPIGVNTGFPACFPTKNIVGTTNAIVAGLGGMGAIPATKFIIEFLFPQFVDLYDASEDPAEKAWRTVTVVPALLVLFCVPVHYCLSDDTPKGNHAKLQKRNGSLQQTLPFFAEYVQQITVNYPNWLLLLIQFACCAGAESSTMVPVWP